MTRVIYANTKNSDMFYAVRVSVPDAFFYIENGDEAYVFLDHREYGVFEEKNKNEKIKLVLLNDYLEKAEKVEGEGSINQKLAEILMDEFCDESKKIEVPTSFPLDLADYLRSKGYEIKPIVEFFPERLKKQEKEVKEIQKSIKLNYLAFERIEEILRDSIIEKEKIVYKGEVLTSEFLKQEVELLLFKNDMITSEGIVISSGEHAVIPHHSGSGPILANQAIICDIFPENKNSKYFADMTRTYIKGKPSEKLQKMYDTVLKAQETAIRAIKPGVRASEIHNICVDIFLKEGFDVGDKGFIHGTGHGFGIDIHENPYLNKVSEAVLEEGNVFTVEPGLYYSGVGGVRIEDNILVTNDGCKNLTDYPKIFVIN